jgi:hypothetical protein
MLRIRWELRSGEPRASASPRPLGELFERQGGWGRQQTCGLGASFSVLPLPCRPPPCGPHALASAWERLPWIAAGPGRLLVRPFRSGANFTTKHDDASVSSRLLDVHTHHRQTLPLDTVDQRLHMESPHAPGGSDRGRARVRRGVELPLSGAGRRCHRTSASASDR